MLTILGKWNIMLLNDISFNDIVINNIKEVKRWLEEKI